MKKKYNKHNKYNKRSNNSRTDNQVFEKAKERIYKFLLKNYHKSYSPHQILTRVPLAKTITKGDVEEILKKMAAENIAQVDDKHRYSAIVDDLQFEGLIEITKDGNGFVLMDDDPNGDIFISKRQLHKVISGDKVRVQLVRSKRRGKSREGKLIEIVERSKTPIIGTLSKAKEGTFLIPSSHKWNRLFLVEKEDMNTAKHGDKVMGIFASWEGKFPKAIVTEGLGKAGLNDTEMHAIVLEFGFATKFPRAVSDAADKISRTIRQNEKNRRKSFIGTSTFTIDPDDAKDFDDALSVTFLENGNYEIGVHIADVSHYVQPNTILDKEARKRGTSVYLVDRTIPMLPEVLSNDVCSLKPFEDKLTFAAVFELDDEANIVREWFGKTVIRSNKRFTYEQAQEIMDKKRGVFSKELLQLNALAYKLREKRFRKGSIDFDTEEVKFELNEFGYPIGIKKKIRKDAHKLVEDFMLLANKRVAHFVSKIKNPENPPFVYRVHDKPDMQKLYKLREFVAQFGYTVDFSEEENIPNQLNKLMKAVLGTPEQDVIQTLAIRSMSKAIYTTHNLGHFGLAFADYTHFTSPIRRYPDLLVHRMLFNYLFKQFGDDPELLETECQYASNQEQRAKDAERASIKYKQAEFLSDHIGEEFAGVISGVTDFGFFVEIEEFLCEGMVRIETLKDDYYFLDEKSYALLGENTGNMLRIGDKVKVKVEETDLLRRTINFIFIEKLDEKHGKKKEE